MPKSYLADEPACQRAERNCFDPYLQVTAAPARPGRDGPHHRQGRAHRARRHLERLTRSAYQAWFVHRALPRTLNDVGDELPGRSTPATSGSPSERPRTLCRSLSRIAGRATKTPPHHVACTKAQQRLVRRRHAHLQPQPCASLYRNGRAVAGRSPQRQRATLEELEPRSTRANEQARAPRASAWWSKRARTPDHT